MERTFIFNGYRVDEGSGEIRFNYAIQSKGQSVGFIEKLTFPNADFSKVPQELLKNILSNLLLILGISYWKLYCPKKIEIKNFSLTKEQAEFWNVVYTKGLGEFFYKNQIDFRGLVNFPYHSNDTYHHSDKAVTFKLKDRSLLMLGGGKDSIVAAEMLKKHNKQFTEFVINDYPIQREIIKLLDVDGITVKREIDPKLLKLNHQRETYNGHVPVSAIYAFIGLLAAVLYDYRYIIASNEASANYGNVEYLGEMINHQWSKSLEFEKMFQDYVKKYMTPSIYYFSLLRPLHEIKIAQLFAKYPKYFSTFSSCNSNFTIKIHPGGVPFDFAQGKQATPGVLRSDSPGVFGKWCGSCPKCAFIFVTLSAFLSKDEVVKIFGKNLLAEQSLITIYQELLGIKNMKPFECIGTPDEAKLAFCFAYKKGEFNNDAVMKMFEKEILPTIKNVDTLKRELLSSSDDHLVPNDFLSISIL